MNINISFGEVEAKRNFPPNRSVEKVDINTNVNFHRVNKKDEDKVEIGFTINISYNPGVGQMNLSGKAYVQGNKEEIKSVEEKDGKPFKKVIGLVSKSSMVQFVKLAEQVNIPAPLPGISPNKGSEEVEKSGKMFG